MSASGPAFQFLPFWEDLNRHLVELVHACPDEVLREAGPNAGWSIREIAVHIAEARHHWLTSSIRDGKASPSLHGATSAVDVGAALVESWQRLEHFLRSPELLAHRYAPPPGDPPYLDPAEFDGHFVAFHRLAHDIHHRASILDKLNERGIELQPERLRRPL